MFLNQLTDKEKEAFLKLAIDAAYTNGDFNTEEHAMIDQYCQEMNLPRQDQYSETALDQLVPIFSSAEDSHKKIVVFELLGLLVADGEFDEAEKVFIHELALSIGVQDSEIDKQMELLKRYMDIVKEIAGELFS